MLKHLVVAALLSAPCLAFAGQGMSIEDGFALASNSGGREIDAAIAPMQEAGGSEAAHEPGVGRGSGDIDAHAQNENAAAHGGHPARGAAAGESGSSHVHKNHGGKAWQSLLPGVMK